MKLWRNNRLDAQYEMSNDEIAAGFLASPWAHETMLLERKLRLYLTSSQADGGLNSVWDDEDAFTEVMAAVVYQRERRHAIAQPSVADAATPPTDPPTPSPITATATAAASGTSASGTEGLVEQLRHAAHRLAGPATSPITDHQVAVRLARVLTWVATTCTTPARSSSGFPTLTRRTTPVWSIPAEAGATTGPPCSPWPAPSTPPGRTPPGPHPSRRRCGQSQRR